MWRLGKKALLTICGWLVLHATAFAQGTPAKADSGSAYLFSYVLVILGIGGGLALVCRPSTRRDRPRTDPNAEIKTIAKK
jgi:hypothetical protein